MDSPRNLNFQVNSLIATLSTIPKHISKSKSINSIKSYIILSNIMSVRKFEKFQNLTYYSELVLENYLHFGNNKYEEIQTRDGTFRSERTNQI